MSMIWATIGAIWFGENTVADAQRYYSIAWKVNAIVPRLWGTSGLSKLTKVNMPGHPDHDELLDWLDMEWEPEDFDLELTNVLLQENDFGCLPLITE